MDFNRLGAFVTKTITRELRAGNPLPRVVERPGSLINSIGIPSRGVPYFLEHTLPYYQKYQPPLVVSISAPTAEDFAGLAAELTRPGVAAIEANISCPNIEEDGKAFAMSAVIDGNRRAAIACRDLAAAVGQADPEHRRPSRGRARRRTGRRRRAGGRQHHPGDGHRSADLQAVPWQHHGRLVGTSDKADRAASGLSMRADA